MVNQRFMKNVVDSTMKKSKVKKYDNENEEFEIGDITFGEPFTLDSRYGRIGFWKSGDQNGATQTYYSADVPGHNVGILLDITVEEIDGYTCTCSYVENYYNYDTEEEVEYDNGTCYGDINGDGMVTAIYSIPLDDGISEVTKSKARKSKAKKSKVRKGSLSFWNDLDVLKQKSREVQECLDKVDGTRDSLKDYRILVGVIASNCRYMNELSQEMLDATTAEDD